MRPAAIFVALTMVLGVGAGPISASAATSDSFFAVASGGAGTACTLGHPCTLTNAIAAAGNDTTGSPVVEIETGAYQNVHVTITAPMKLENADLRDPAPVLHGDGAHPVITVATTMTGISGIEATGGTDGLLVQSGGIGTVLNSRFDGNSDDGIDDRATAPFEAYQGVTADGNGASGIAVSGTGAVGIVGSTFSNNSGDGITFGALDNANIPTGTVQHSTVYGNQQNGVAALHQGQLNLSFSSVVSNGGHGFYTESSGLMDFGAVILVGNGTGVSKKECAQDGTFSGANTADGGGNIVDDATCLLNSGHSSVNTTIAIGPLANYGGPTDTMAIPKESPAAQYVSTPITNNVSQCGGGHKDQRGLVRPDLPCAAGAFDPYATPLAPTVTLSASPSAAHGAFVGGRITLTATVTGGVGPATGGTVDFTTGPDPGSLSPITTCNQGAIADIPVVDGTATCAVPAATVGTFRFGATFTGSPTYAGGPAGAISAYPVRANPTLVAHLSSTAAKTKYGWYRTPVKVSWTCTAGSGTVVGACPAATTLSASKAKQSVTKTIHNSFGGSVTVTSPAVNIDRVKPTIAITGVKSGHTYPRNTKLAPKCVAKDALSGPAGKCTTKTTHKASAAKIAFVATATAHDRAGNKTVKTVSWTVRG